MPSKPCFPNTPSHAGWLARLTSSTSESDISRTASARCRSSEPGSSPRSIWGPGQASPGNRCHPALGSNGHPVGASAGEGGVPRARRRAARAHERTCVPQARRGAGDRKHGGLLGSRVPRRLRDLGDRARSARSGRGARFYWGGTRSGRTNFRKCPGFDRRWGNQLLKAADPSLSWLDSE